jgi:drug/metabolite transporter (DMT)-like permease
MEPIVFVPPTVSTLSINDLPTQNNNWRMRFSGIIYALIASFLFTCATFSIKLLGVDLLDALLLRFIIQTLITFLFVRHKHYPFLFGTAIEIFLQFLCCATGAGGFFLYFIAIRYAELSDVTTISYTRVVWTVVFGICIYRERPSLSLLIALPLTLLGVVFVAQPSFLFSSTNPSIAIVNNKLRLLGLGLSTISSLTSTTNVLSFKRLVSTSKSIKSSVINFQYCLAILILLIINQLYKKFLLHTGLSFNYMISWRYLLASFVCLVLIAANILTQKAIKREHPAIFTVLGSADIIFSLILQNIFTTKRSNLFAILGSALVIFSVVIIGLSKILTDRSAQTKIKLMDKQIIIKDFDEKNDKC